MYENTNTTTFSVVSTRGEQSVREWEDRLANTNTIARFLNSTTVTTLLTAINRDDDFIRVAVISMGIPSLTHSQLMREYGVGNTGSFSKAIMSPDRNNTSRLNGIRNDLRTLCDQGDRSANGRVWSLLAYAAWVAGDKRAMREAIDAAQRLTRLPGKPDRTPNGIPLSSDPITVIMGGLLVMAEHDAHTTEIVQDTKAEWAKLSTQWDRELAALPPARTPFSDVIVPSFDMPQRSTFTVPRLSFTDEPSYSPAPSIDFAGFGA